MASKLPILGLLTGAGLAGYGYRVDGSVAFYLGLAAMAAALAASSYRAARRGGSASVLTMNFAISFLLVLPLLELGWRALDADAAPAAPAKPVYSYDDARGDPRAFRRWWRRYVREWNRGMARYTQRPGHRGAGLLRPGTRTRLFDSELRINELGFRGPSLSLTKGGRYRIVALGESTTFGATLEPHDRPWPEILEERIAAELACRRPIEVVNAGVPGWDLSLNLARLEHDIVPLEPDLVVSYHGFNGFRFMLDGIAPVASKGPSETPPRPSRLLGRVEEGLRGWWFRRRYARLREEAEAAAGAKLLESRYADLYRQLIEMADARGFRLVLCTFNLAVDADSPDEVVRFYEGGFPQARALVIANRLHNELVRQLGKQYDVPVVEATPGLDGVHELYIDLVHYTQPGRERLAQNILAGLKPLLAAQPELSCEPRSAPPPGLRDPRRARTE